MRYQLMKNNFPLLLLIVLTSIAIPQQQEEDKAFAILDGVGQHRNFRAKFAYHSQLPQGHSEKKLEGTITVQDSQYYLTTADREVISNGETVWTYLIAAQEVEIDDYHLSQEVATPWTLLSNYQQDYELFELCHQKVDEQFYDVVTLVARDKESTLPQVVLTIERGNSHIKRLEMLDSSENWHIFSIIQFETDLALDPSFFNFDPEQHADIEVIDMR